MSLSLSLEIIGVKVLVECLLEPNLNKSVISSNGVAH